MSSTNEQRQRRTQVTARLDPEIIEVVEQIGLVPLRADRHGRELIRRVLGLGAMRFNSPIRGRAFGVCCAVLVSMITVALSFPSFQ